MESDLELGQFRLLDVDNRVVVPVDTHIRIIVTGNHLPLLYCLLPLALPLPRPAPRL